MPTPSEPSWIRRRLAGVGATAGGLLLIATALSLLGPRWWGFELLVPFRPQYVAFSLIALGLARLLPGRAWALPAVALIVNLVFVVPRLPSGTTSADGAALRVMSFNVHTRNRAFDEVRDEIRSSSPDVVFALEVDQRWAESLATLDGYEVVVARPSPDNFGIMALSRVPVASHRVMAMGEAMLPTIELVVPWAGRELGLLATHTLPPIDRGTTEMRDGHLAQAARWAKSSTRSVALFGDLNVTAFSGVFAALEEQGGLRAVGSALQTTWPARPGWLFWMGIALDHALVGEGLVATSVEVGAACGSDHRPIVVDLALVD